MTEFDITNYNEIYQEREKTKSWLVQYMQWV